MHDVKRIEIIANSFELGKIVEALKTSEINNYALIRGVAGKQLHAGNEDLDMTMLDNIYIIAFCKPELLQGAVESIRPLLNRWGGTCHISDAQEVKSMKCVEKLNQ